jgi:hypothetical protein
MEEAIAAFNKNRAKARAKKSRIILEEPPVDSSSDESVDSGCEHPMARRKRNKPKLQLPGRKICLKMIFFLLSQNGQNANTKKVMKPTCEEGHKFKQTERGSEGWRCCSGTKRCS